MSNCIKQMIDGHARFCVTRSAFRQYNCWPLFFSINFTVTFKQINNCISVNVHVPWLGDYLRRLFCGFARANCWGNFHRPDNNSFGSSNHGSRFIPAFFIPSEAHNCRCFVLINVQINNWMNFFQKLQLSDDVAGATFMAAGSSAPELFTSLIGELSNYWLELQIL